MPTGYKLTDDDLAAAVAAYVNEKTFKSAAETIDIWGTKAIISHRLDMAERRAGALLFKRDKRPARRPVLTEAGIKWLQSNLYFLDRRGRWNRYELLEINPIPIPASGDLGSGDLMDVTTEPGSVGG